MVYMELANGVIKNGTPTDCTFSLLLITLVIFGYSHQGKKDGNAMIILVK